MTKVACESGQTPKGLGIPQVINWRFHQHFPKFAFEEHDSAGNGYLPPTSPQLAISVLSLGQTSHEAVSQSLAKGLASYERFHFLSQCSWGRGYWGAEDRLVDFFDTWKPTLGPLLGDWASDECVPKVALDNPGPRSLIQSRLRRPIEHRRNRIEVQSARFIAGGIQERLFFE